MRVLVTGAAGFIGSHLCERLLGDGHAVTGVDNFDTYYARAIKEDNLSIARSRGLDRFFKEDLSQAEIDPLLADCDAVVHLAGKPGVRQSWGEAFREYLDDNVLSTQRLLEAVRRKPVKAFVFISSSSVYHGSRHTLMREDELLQPESPYGASKLAAEAVASLYARLFDLPVVVLRPFSIYGPRERPDKAIQRFLIAARDGLPIRVHGDGTQRRDFTFVGDLVEGIMRCLDRVPGGEIINIARGETHPLTEVLDIVQRVSGSTLEIHHGPRRTGDVAVTAASLDKARALLDYAPQVDLAEGIARQWEAVKASPRDSAPAN